MLNTKKNLALAFALAIGAGAAGCASSDKGGGGGDDTGGDDGGSDDVTALRAEGTYDLESEFDLLTGMPGKAGTIANEFVKATDDSNDPAHYLLSLAIEKINNQTIKNILQSSEPFFAAYLNDRLLEWAPDFVETFVDVGDKVGQMTRNFGFTSELDVRASGSSYIADHTVNGFIFKVDGETTTYSFEDIGELPISVTGLGAEFTNSGKFVVDEHQISIPYGSYIRVGLDYVIIPAIDSSSKNLGELLAKKVNCEKFGDLLNEENGSVTASVAEVACDLALQAAAGYLYSKIADINGGATDFSMSGEARGYDTQHNGTISELRRGEWEGGISYGGSAPVNMTDATWSGVRR